MAEAFVDAKGSQVFFDRIEEWINDYCFDKEPYRDLTLSELAGAAPLFVHLGTLANLPDHESSPSFGFVRRMHATHKGCIDLLPSGFHALLSVLPQVARQKLATLMGKGLVIVDPPSQVAIHTLIHHDFDSLQAIFRGLSLSGGVFKPVRLSQVTMRLKG
jgi:hypothetical protein